MYEKEKKNVLLVLLKSSSPVDAFMERKRVGLCTHVINGHQRKTSLIGTPRVLLNVCSRPAALEAPPSGVMHVEHCV